MSITHQHPSRERPGHGTCDTSRSYEIGWSKVPEVTLAFWVIKVAATTIGETGGDALSMTMHLGYALSTAVFLTLFMVTVAAQVASKSFRPFLYWGVIVATTTAGTTMADFADRSLGIGYVGGSLVLLTLLMAVLGLWWFSVGSVSFNQIVSRKVETFYWATILFEYARDRSGRLFCRRFGAGVRRGGDRLRRRVGARRGRLLPHEGFSHLAVLVGVHPHPSAWRDVRRPAHQAIRARRPQPRPHQFLSGYRDLYRRMHPVHVQEGWLPSRGAWTITPFRNRLISPCFVV